MAQARPMTTFRLPTSPHHITVTAYKQQRVTRYLKTVPFPSLSRLIQLNPHSFNSNFNSRVRLATNKQATPSPTMLSRQVARPLLRASRLPLTRSFSVAAVRMGAGDTGSVRPGGIATGYVQLLSSIGCGVCTNRCEQ